MSRKKKPYPILENITIQDVAAEGKCVVRVNDLVVFVPFCVPGDVVDLQIKRKKHSYAEAEVVRFVEYSKNRTQPMCEHFGVCGGCKWQNMPYESQLAFKQKQVHDQLQRIGKIELPEFMPIKGSVKTSEYRNKLDFGCSSKQWLTREQMEQGIPFHPGIGFHITGAFDKILPIEKCWLMDDLQNQIRNYIYRYACDNAITFYDLRAQHGLLRDLVLRNSLSGEWMLVVQFGPTEQIANNKESIAEEIANESQFDKETAFKLLEAVHQQFPQITSLQYVYNPKCNDTFGDLDVKVYYGKDHIFELMEDLKFKVGPKSFYQTNTEQAYHLYCVARDFADLNGEGLVYDLYTGTGTIANFVSKKAKHVIGIEYVPEAIEDAKVNSQINGIDNTEFYAGDMKDILTDDFIAEHGRPDVIITDPPRAGMHPDVIQVILNAHPQRIVYVSCNPATQARDLQLMDADYKVVAVQPVDMFPHTPHVENVVLLEARQ
ncbi:MAG: 23S rRNA (uracil(1939)-C(5))-methyltransferase RlmD [Prevotella sp.]|nr:23S rRNA (uracil(1939)-C(5))-methyltransferase RlmD [Candidatus Prevotella equi]